MQVHLIQRKKIVHAGIKMRNMGQTYLVSVCSGAWYDSDTTSIGESDGVTCKRCIKYVKEAEQNNGVVNLKGKK